VPTITKATDRKLSSLEEKLSEKVCMVEWANVEDAGHLAVSFARWITHTPEKKETIIKIINSMFK